MGLAGALGGKHFLECSVVTAHRRSTLWLAVATAGARGMGLLLAALVLQGCFDVHQGDPGNGRFLIDDFEDGDPLPKATALFGQWRCFTFNPFMGQDPAQSVNCDLERPGDASGYALFASFSLHDSPNGQQEFGGAGLVTATSTIVDFNGYQNLVFSLRVDFGNLPTTSYAYISLDCDSVMAERPKQTEDQFQLEYQIAATDSWTTYSVSLSKFVQPDWEKNRFANGPQTCLAAVDSINFQVQGQLLDGQSGHGVIHLDDVYLE
jgi:hypothetical protein